MKKMTYVVILLLLLSGCTSKEESLTRIIKLRENVLQSSGCSFTAEVTADYGDKIYVFEMQCKADADGTVQFSVIAPNTIAGIGGELSSVGGKLIFDETVLAIAMLADGQISPVSAPWLFVHTLQSGYISSAVTEQDQFHVTFTDTYKENAFQMDLWLDRDDKPCRAEIIWEGYRILSISVKDFVIA